MRKGLKRPPPGDAQPGSGQTPPDFEIPAPYQQVQWGTPPTS